MDTADTIFHYLSRVDSIFWGYVAFVLIMLLGGYLTLRTYFFQVWAFPSIFMTFFRFLGSTSLRNKRGVHPLKVFFTSVGGMVGIGNVVGIVTAIQIGGPGALLWVWIAALIGSIIKYSEVYLGFKYRVKNDQGGYDGGPMYFLRHAFSNRWIPLFVSFLLCVYGVELYQFVVLTDSLSMNLDINRYAVITILLFLIIYASAGGVSRISKFCSYVLPVFLLSYISMSLYVIFQEAALLPSIINNVFVSAFSGHAAVGGFAGSSVLLAMQHGMARSAYSADIGIGFDSIIQSESQSVHPERQARLAILGVGLDNLICTMSILVVLVSGIWTSTEPLEGSQLVQKVLGQYFPYMHLYMPLFLFVCGYTTIIAYFCVGIKCAKFISPTYGPKIYVVYGAFALVFFSFFHEAQALIVMSIFQAMLLITNLIGIFILRREVEYKAEPMFSSATPETT